MKKMSLIVFVILATIIAVNLVQDAEAAPAGVNLSYSFAGCSGNEATFDLTASITNGGTYTWGWNVTPVSAATDNPNYAKISFITWQRQPSVHVVNKMTSSSASVVLTNPCISP